MTRLVDVPRDSNLGTTSVDNNGLFVIGKKSNGGLPYTGKLDDIRVFNRALTSAEAEKIYLESKVFQ